jgi:hypothetical protein
LLHYGIIILLWSMRKLLFAFLVTGVLTQAYGWGSTGHRTTGLIAEKYLNKKAIKTIQGLLKGQSLAMASTWMDEVRSDSSFDYMDDWHWVTIPTEKSYDQTMKNPNGDIIQSIEQIIVALKSRKLTPEEHVRKLKILIHLIGDIHQPLHVGSRDDKGGNDVRLTWFKNESNLHRVWDSEMIDDTKLSFTELAESLDKPDNIQIKKWQSVSVREWAKESQSYEKQVYSYGNGKLGYRYSYQNFHIVRLRLLQAGVRLAGVLNEIYGK